MTTNEPVAIVRAEPCRRSQILGTQVINQASAARLGIIDQVWVDVIARQVVALGVLGPPRPLEPGAMVLMDLNQARAVGPDAILVDSEEAFESYPPVEEGLVKVVGFEVVTEAGVRLGKVKDFIFEPGSGFLSDLVLSNLGIPLLPGQIDSTYLLASEEILEVGPRRLIAAEGAETQCVAETTSYFLKWFNIGKPAWEQREPIAALPPGRASIFEEDYEDRYDQSYDDYPDYEEDYEYEQAYDDYDAVYEPEPEPEPIRPRRPRSRRVVPTPPIPRPSAAPVPPVKEDPSPEEIWETEENPQSTPVTSESPVAAELNPVDSNSSAESGDAPVEDKDPDLQS